MTCQKKKINKKNKRTGILIPIKFSGRKKKKNYIPTQQYENVR